MCIINCFILAEFLFQTDLKNETFSFSENDFNYAIAEQKITKKEQKRYLVTYFIFVRLIIS